MSLGDSEYKSPAGRNDKKFMDCKNKSAKLKKIQDQISAAISEIFDDIDDEELVDAAKNKFSKVCTNFNP